VDCQKALERKRKRVEKVERECRFCGGVFVVSKGSLQTVCKARGCRNALHEETQLRYLAKLSETRPSFLADMKKRRQEYMREYLTEYRRRGKAA
jgi:hypothetical protein